MPHNICPPHPTYTYTCPQTRSSSSTRHLSLSSSQRGVASEASAALSGALPAAALKRCSAALGGAPQHPWSLETAARRCTRLHARTLSGGVPLRGRAAVCFRRGPARRTAWRLRQLRRRLRLRAVRRSQGGLLLAGWRRGQCRPSARHVCWTARHAPRAAPPHSGVAACPGGCYPPGYGDSVGFTAAGSGYAQAVGSSGSCMAPPVNTAPGYAPSQMVRPPPDDPI